MVTARDEQGCGKQPPQWEAGCHQYGLDKHTHIQDRPIRVRKTQRQDAQRYAQGQGGGETPGIGTRMTGTRQLRLPFSIGSLTRQGILCQNTSNMPRGCRSCGVQRPKMVELVRDPTLVPRFTVPRLSILPGRHAPGFSIQIFVGSFMSAKQPTRKPTGKRKESDASAQEGRERKRAAKRKGLEGGLPPAGRTGRQEDWHQSKASDPRIGSRKPVALIVDEKSSKPVAPKAVKRRSW